MPTQIVYPDLQRIAIVASSSGANTLVAAVTGKKIHIVNFIVSASGAVNFKFQSHVTPTDITGLFYLAAAGSFMGAANDFVGWGSTNTGEALDINLSGAVAVGGVLHYSLL